VVFSLSVSEKIPYQSGMFWPGITEAELAPGDLVITHSVDDPEKISEELLDEVVSLSNGYITYTTDYEINDETLIPDKQIRIDYSVEDDEEQIPTGLVELYDANYINATQISEDPDDDRLLRSLDSEWASSFSETDVQEIADALGFLGFKNNYMRTE
jgi:hypothetical protein